MVFSKKWLYTAMITFVVFSGLMIGSIAPSVASAPEPKCVCDGCGKACGSGHTSTCPYRPR